MKRLALASLLVLAAFPASAWASAEGPGTPQATAANATFLSNAPIPPTGRGVCVIDSGVDTDTDLGSALVGRTSSLGSGGSTDPGDSGTLSDSGDPLPKHGTYVAGIIASQIDGKGTSGIWPAAKVYSARVLAGGAATAEVSDYITAINWCRAQPSTKVINLSLSGLGGATSAQRASLDDKIAEVVGPLYNINVVAAAGNNGSNATVGYPASAGGVFAVGATDGIGALAPFSNGGNGLDIATFGVDSCLTTNHGSNIATGRGTSYATPVVSAVLAALRSYDPSLTPAQAERLLIDNADTFGGVKVLNAARAFRSHAAVAGLASGQPAIGAGTTPANACEPPTVPATYAGEPASQAGTTLDSQGADAPAGSIDMPVGAPVTAPVIEHRAATTYPVAPAKPSKPTIKSISWRRNLLIVRIHGRKDGDLAVFQVDRRRFVRDSSVFRLRVATWKTIRIQLEHPGAGRSPALTIRSIQEF